MDHPNNFLFFPFENYLYSVKQMIRGPTHVVQQVICRLREQNELDMIHNHDNSLASPYLTRRHLDGPLIHDISVCKL